MLRPPAKPFAGPHRDTQVPRQGKRSDIEMAIRRSDFKLGGSRWIPAAISR
jgi:hypothetical protein